LEAWCVGDVDFEVRVPDGEPAVGVEVDVLAGVPALGTVGKPGAAGVAVVTGAARGIGQGIAARLVGDGFDVVAADRDPEVEATAREIGARGVVCDVANEESVRALADAAGRVRVLVNNAGIWHY
jgi:D-arabinose 1-dehydrogenase-like Zn-dependent alcohol dehydrogenase